MYKEMEGERERGGEVSVCTSKCVYMYIVTNPTNEQRQTAK